MQFLNCADISIGGPGAPTTTVATTPVIPAADPITTTTTAAATAPAGTTIDTAAAATVPTTSSRKLAPGGNGGSAAAAVCAASGDGFFPAPWSCAQYVACGPGVAAAQSCDGSLLWDAAASTCNLAAAVDCAGRP